MPDAAQLAASIQACRPRNDYPGCGAAVEVGEPFEMSVSDRRDRAGARIRCRRPQRPHPAGTPSVAILRGVLDRLWTAATRHPFLDAVREGTITDSAFILIVANDPGYMGTYVNGRVLNIAASVYLVVILAASLAAIPLMIVTGAGQ